MTLRIFGAERSIEYVVWHGSRHVAFGSAKSICESWACGADSHPFYCGICLRDSDGGTISLGRYADVVSFEAPFDLSVVTEGWHVPDVVAIGMEVSSRRESSSHKCFGFSLAFLGSLGSRDFAAMSPAVFDGALRADCVGVSAVSLLSQHMQERGAQLFSATSRDVDADFVRKLLSCGYALSLGLRRGFSTMFGDGEPVTLSAGHAVCVVPLSDGRSCVADQYGSRVIDASELSLLCDNLDCDGVVLGVRRWSGMAFLDVAKWAREADEDSFVSMPDGNVVDMKGRLWSHIEGSEWLSLSISDAAFSEKVVAYVARNERIASAAGTLLHVSPEYDNRELDFVREDKSMEMEKRAPIGGWGALLEYSQDHDDFEIGR